MPAYGIVVASVGADWEGAQFLLLYPDRGTAEAGGAALDGPLRDVPGLPEMAKVNVDILEADAGVIAAVTVLFAPGTPDHPSSLLINRWRQAIWGQRLSLSLAP